MSEVGRTEKDEKIAELEVWVFRELCALPGSGRRREETRPRAPAVRFALRRVARLRGREWAGYARRYPVPTRLWGGHVHLTYGSGWTRRAGF